MKKYSLIIVCLLAVLFVFANASSYIKEEYNFKFNGDKLEGFLIQPEDLDSDTLLVFVHGDGAMPYDAFGYYDTLFENLAKNGISSYSYSKKGVEGSQGNWLHQSMNDRAEEVITLINQIKKEKKFKKIGIIGFSQAGWVLPLVSKESNIHDFSIYVSPAINWMQQKEFYEKNHKNEKEKDISFDRKIFIEKNKNSDASKSLTYVDEPVLLLLGNKDKNVDIKNTKETFSKILNKNLSTKTFDATHAMLKPEYFSEDSDGLYKLLKILFLEEDAFAKGYFETILTFIKGLEESK